MLKGVDSQVKCKLTFKRCAAQTETYVSLFVFLLVYCRFAPADVLALWRSCCGQIGGQDDFNEALNW